MILRENWRGCLGGVLVAVVLPFGGQAALGEDQVAVSTELTYMSDEERKAWQEGLTTQSIKTVPEAKTPVVETEERPVIKTARQQPEAGIDTHSKTAIQSCKSEVNDHLKLSPIEFLPGRSTLSPSNKKIIKELATLLLDCAVANVIVEGHTDDRGNPDENQRLSGRRAQSVMEALIQNGVQSKRLRAVGYGDLKPIASNETPESRAQNRRIELTLY